jgi:hypothetical protein
MNPGWVFLPFREFGSYVWATHVVAILRLSDSTSEVLLTGAGSLKMPCDLSAEEVLDIIDAASDAADRDERERVR